MCDGCKKGTFGGNGWNWPGRDDLGRKKDDLGGFGVCCYGGVVGFVFWWGFGRNGGGLVEVSRRGRGEMGKRRRRERERV